MAKWVQLKDSGFPKLTRALMVLQGKLVELAAKKKVNRGLHQLRMLEADARSEHGRNRVQ